MDPIDVEPLNSMLQATLLPYGTSEDETTIAEGFKEKESFPLESQNSKSSNLKDNPVLKTIGTMGNDTEPEANSSGSRENSPIEKQGNQYPNPDDSSIRTNIDPLEEEQQPL